MRRKSPLIARFDRMAPAMENLPDFYDWVVGVFSHYHLAKDASIADVGCGPGALLERLAGLGYGRLLGTDFSQASLKLAAPRAPGARLLLHDIEEAPLPETQDVVLMTTVMDFLASPHPALANVRATLRPGGLFFVTIRNLWAYFPWYHLRGLAGSLERLPRARHWLLQLTTPLALRRGDWPYEAMYTPRDARSMLAKAGFRIVGVHGAQVLPMLWVPGVPWMRALQRVLEGSMGLVAPPWLKYRLMFVCTAP
ncbi:MAG: class I SAM-dependent methyltransferase [Chloroflexi bacterium]|nr:class I SAM-dependent methyltransferase [Chloroflexota bacterium]